MQIDLSYAIYAGPLLTFWLLHLHGKRKEEARSLSARAEAQANGLTQPASLHPVIDPSLCMGCGSCVAACPEGEILGLISGKAELVEPSHCIGHGACKTACPFDAISLVFGTEERGVDIPNVAEDFQTNVPGLFIAGELGGMGLIRNAIEQGRQAADSIAKSLPKRTVKQVSGPVSASSLYDVVIVGAGPAGFAASLAAMEKGLRYLTIEQDSLGGTVAHFPRGKLVMTQPATLPMVGKVNFRETTKEKLLEFWEGVLVDTEVKINFQEQVESITPLTGANAGKSGFTVRTNRGSYNASTVLLAIGRRGTPRKLDVAGEELSKVVYRMIDPAQYQGQDVLVVGGGDSAIEAAVSISEEPGATVTLSYRGDAFNRTKPKNRENLEQRVAEGRLKLHLKSTVKDISAKSVRLKTESGLLSLKNDSVIVCAGGILPTGFLKSIGIEIETKYGMA
jgi:thioredoxin reductase (NADPH)